MKLLLISGFTLLDTIMLWAQSFLLIRVPFLRVRQYMNLRAFACRTCFGSLLRMLRIFWKTLNEHMLSFALCTGVCLQCHIFDSSLRVCQMWLWKQLNTQRSQKPRATGIETQLTPSIIFIFYYFIYIQIQYIYIHYTDCGLGWLS